MGRTLTKTQMIAEDGEYVAYPAGTDESDIPAKHRPLIREKAYMEPVDMALGIDEADENGEIPDSLTTMTAKQLDKLGEMNEIDLSKVRRKEDKIDVLRSAGIGVPETAAS